MYAKIYYVFTVYLKKKLNFMQNLRIYKCYILDIEISIFATSLLIISDILFSFVLHTFVVSIDMLLSNEPCSPPKSK